MLPVTSALTTIVLGKSGFMLGYSPLLKNPLWVYEILNEEHISKNIELKRRCRFRIDQQINAISQARLKDYKFSGFTRGHMAMAAQHRYSFLELRETFYLSNISPQIESFNKGIWNQLEIYLKSKIPEYQEVHLVSGPLFKTVAKTDTVAVAQIQWFGTSRIAIPKGFYKVFLGFKASGEYSLFAFICPHQDISPTTPLSSFQVSLTDVEEAAGLKIFNGFGIDPSTRSPC